jgi:2'-5' RNA ligase
MTTPAPTETVVEESVVGESVSAATETEEFQTAADVHSLAMVALVPTEGNVERLAVEGGEGGEGAGELHCTVLFLGDAEDITDESFVALRDSMQEIASTQEGPLVAEAFNVSVFNPHRDDRDTCLVLGLTGDNLARLATDMRTRAEDVLLGFDVMVPDQHTPWIPHVTLTYTDDMTRVSDLVGLTGEITFDRIRVARGEEVHDFTLGVTDTEEEEEPSPAEEGTEIEFAQESVSEDTVTEEFDTSTDTMAVEEGITQEEITEEPVEISSTQAGSWNGVLVVEDVESGDGRMFSAGSLKTAPLPLPLMWQKQTASGHETAVQVGRIDDVWRDGNQIWGSGVFDLGGDDGREAHRQVEEKFLRGVSVDVDSVKNSDVEMIFPPSTGDGGELDLLFMEPDVTVFHNGRLRGATLVQFPAFVEASITLTGPVVADTPALEASGEEFPIRELDPVVASGGASGDDEDEPTLPDAALTIPDCGCQDNPGHLTACACEESDGELWTPDSAMFANPQFRGPMPLTVDGMHIYGHAALKNTCHTGFAGQCVTMPRETSHDYFLLGETACSDGSVVATGTITLGTGHAGTDGRITPFDAIKHYDNTGTVVADIVTGEDEFGLWFSGALRPGLAPSKIRSLRAAKLSGDWRKFGNKLRLVALLAVNVPGFPVPRMRSAMQNGRQVALVAASINPTDARNEEKSRTNESLSAVMQSIAKRMGRDRETRMTQLKSHVHGR